MMSIPRWAVTRPARLLPTLALALAITLGLAAAGAQAQSFDAAELTQLSLKNLTGTIRVTGSDAATVSVTAAERGDFGSCSRSAQRTGSELVVTVTRAAGASADCRVDFDITVPKAFDLSLVNGSGDITVQATTGRLTFQTGSGNVTARGGFAEVTGRSGSGDLVVAGLVGGGGLRTGSGNISVTYNLAPEPGGLEIRAGTGNVDVCMPTGTLISTRISVGSGKVDNRLGNDPKADYFISIQVGTGSVRLAPTCWVPTATR